MSLFKIYLFIFNILLYPYRTLLNFLILLVESKSSTTSVSNNFFKNNYFSIFIYLFSKHKPNMLYDYFLIIKNKNLLKKNECLTLFFHYGCIYHGSFFPWTFGNKRYSIFNPILYEPFQCLDTCDSSFLY